MKPAVQPFPLTAPRREQECQSCADLRAENEQLRERIERLTHALHRDAGDLYDKRADSHDKPTWTYLTQGRPAGRSGDVK